MNTSHNSGRYMFFRKIKNEQPTLRRYLDRDVPSHTAVVKVDIDAVIADIDDGIAHMAAITSRTEAMTALA